LPNLKLALILTCGTRRAVITKKNDCSKRVELQVVWVMSLVA